MNGIYLNISTYSFLFLLRHKLYQMMKQWDHNSTQGIYSPHHKYLQQANLYFYGHLSLLGQVVHQNPKKYK